MREILSESEGIPDKMCDVPLCENTTPLNALNEHSEIVVNLDNDNSSSDDDSPYGEDIDYVDASSPDVEIVSLEVVGIVDPEVGRIDDDILLTIKDDILCEKLLNVNLRLFLNVDKTERFRPVEDPRGRMEGVFPINISRPLNGVKLLGGSVSLDLGFCRNLALKRVSKTISLMEAIYKLHDRQCELLLLHNCVGVAKLSYALMTCSPLSLLEAQVEFDQALRASLEKIVTALGPEFGDWQWRLATLPIKLGGLGILSARDIIHYAFLASRL
ncbi:hypothetical protein Tco_0962125 [Tanacetum coccineum]